jgi:hypothetical protein
MNEITNDYLDMYENENGLRRAEHKRFPFFWEQRGWGGVGYLPGRRGGGEQRGELRTRGVNLALHRPKIVRCRLHLLRRLHNQK